MFDNSPLPFKLASGFVGKLSIKIPAWDFFKSPLVIEVQDVFGFIKLKPEAEWKD
jgi:hypothetical protein